jgi:predicted AlkP superfamily phosphohydrolase/phosphomutase
MTETLTVLGIDAADYRLARQWDCSNILLGNSQEIQTFSYSLDVPATLEVWPTIATGKLPQEHGIVLDQVG